MDLRSVQTEDFKSKSRLLAKSTSTEQKLQIVYQVTPGQALVKYTCVLIESFKFFLEIKEE